MILPLFLPASWATIEARALKVYKHRYTSFVPAFTAGFEQIFGRVATGGNGMVHRPPYVAADGEQA